MDTACTPYPPACVCSFVLFYSLLLSATVYREPCVRWLPLFRDPGFVEGGRAGKRFSVWHLTSSQRSPRLCPFWQTAFIEKSQHVTFEQFLILWSWMLLTKPKPGRCHDYKTHALDDVLLTPSLWICQGIRKQVNQWRFLGISWRKECICCSVYVESAWNRARIQVVS